MAIRRMVSLLLMLGVGVALGSWLDSDHSAGAQGVCATENGDVNGDGTRDIADAVYMLTWLFSQGPEPEPICPTPVPSGLPDTGQTTCYDQTGNVADCATGPCFGQDGYYDTGCPSGGPLRFVDNGDGTVSDLCTGLMWQKDTADLNGDGVIQFPNDFTTWCDALAYCESLVLGTDPAGGQYDDWRLPNVRELQSIVDFGTVGPAIDPVFSASSGFYWSSTSRPDVPFTAWIVAFTVGFVGFDGKDFGNLVRAVRSGP